MATKYISQEAAIKTLRKAEALYRKCMVSQVRADMIDHCIKLVNDVPTADVVEVVRCGECRYNPKRSWVHCPMTGADTRKPNDFCSYGKRRVDNG